MKQFHMVTGDDHHTDLASLLNDHFKSGKSDFGVLICDNDRVAFVVYQAFLAKGVRIPQDVAVMGSDNLVGVGHPFLPPLTTIQLPHDIIGREAALYIIEGREGGRVTRIPCPLLIRCSTRYCVNPVARVLHVTAQSLRGGYKATVPVLLVVDRFDYSSPLPRY